MLKYQVCLSQVLADFKMITACIKSMFVVL